MNRLYKNQKGFTLIELLMAVAVLAVIATPIFGLYSATFKNNQAAKDKTIAVALAQAKLEELKSKDYEELTVMIGNDIQETPVEEGSKFNRRTEVFQKSPGLLEIRVTVYWNDGEMKLSTLKGDIE